MAADLCRFFLGMAVAVAVLSACAKSEPDAFVYGRFKAEDTRLDCGTAGNAVCEKGVVGLLFRLKTISTFWQQTQELGRCTAFVVAPTVIATNNHCLPGTSLRSEGPLEHYYFRMISNKSGRPGKLMKVTEVLSTETVNDYDIYSSDYAFLRLESAIEVEPLELDRSGFLRGEQLSAWVVNHRSRTIEDQSDLKFVLDSQGQCRVAEVAWHHPFPYSPGLETLTLSHCPVMPGNSGGPAIGRNGKVKGIIYALINTENVLDDFKKQMPTAKKSTRKPVEMAMVTNLACVPEIPDFEKSTEITPVACQRTRDQLYNEQQKGRPSMVDDLEVRIQRNSIRRVLREDPGQYQTLMLTEYLNDSNSLKKRLSQRQLGKAETEERPYCYGPGLVSVAHQVSEDKYEMSVESHIRRGPLFMNEFLQFDFQVKEEEVRGATFSFTLDAWQSAEVDSKPLVGTWTVGAEKLDVEIPTCRHSRLTSR